MSLITVIKPSFFLPEFTLETLDQLPKHVERCGRVCYKSEDKITESSCERFVSNICRNRHESVLEHANLTAIVTCSRSCSHQIVRHRIAAISQESQRYCDYGKKGLQVICPPSIGVPEGQYRFGDSVGLTQLQDMWIGDVDNCYCSYLTLMSSGIKAEDARYMLPNAVKTELALTYNVRMWRHIFQERALNKHAQWEIRELFLGIFHVFKDRLPSFFGDLE